MASMSLSMSPKFMLANKLATSYYDTPRLANSVTYVRRVSHARRMIAVRAAPDKLSDNVEKSIQEAQEACEDDPVGSECVAAWDVVEEVSAAASHARVKAKDSDPLDEYCKDNPETDECKTYDN